MASVEEGKVTPRFLVRAGGRMMMPFTEMEKSGGGTYFRENSFRSVKVKFSVGHQSGDVNRQLDTPGSGSGEWL